MNTIDYLGGIGWMLGISYIVAAIPALVFGLIAHSRGYSFLKQFLFSLLIFGLAVFVPYASGFYMGATLLILLAALGGHIWYFVKKRPRKVLTYERKTTDQQ